MANSTFYPWLKFQANKLEFMKDKEILTDDGTKYGYMDFDKLNRYVTI